MVDNRVSIVFDGKDAGAKKVMENIAHLSKVVTAELKKMGVAVKTVSLEPVRKQAEKVATSMKKAIPPTQSFMDKMRKMGGVMIGVSLSMLFFGMAIQRYTMAVLRGTVTVFNRVMQESEQFGSAIQILGVHWEYLKFVIGRVINDVLTPLLPKIINIINLVRDWVTEHPKLTTAILLGGLALGTFIMTLGILAAAFSGIFNFIAKATSLFGTSKTTGFAGALTHTKNSANDASKAIGKSKSTGLRGFIAAIKPSPATVALLAFAAAMYLLYDQFKRHPDEMKIIWKDFVDGFKREGAKFKTSLEELFGIQLPVMDTALDTTAGYLMWFLDIWLTFGGAFVDSARAAIDTLDLLANGLYNFFKLMTARTPSEALKWASALKDTFVTDLTDVWTDIKDAFSAFPDTLDIIGRGPLKATDLAKQLETENVIDDWISGAKSMDDVLTILNKNFGDTTNKINDFNNALQPYLGAGFSSSLNTGFSTFPGAATNLLPQTPTTPAGNVVNVGDINVTVEGGTTAEGQNFSDWASEMKDAIVSEISKQMNISGVS